MRVSMLLAVFLALGGCASSPPPDTTKYDRILATGQTAQAKARTCHQHNAEQPYAKVLSDVVWMSTDEGEAPLSYYLTEGTATEAQLQPLDKFARASLSCDRALLDAVAGIRRYRLITEGFIDRKRNIYLALLRRDITFGEAHKQLQELRTVRDRAWEESRRVFVDLRNDQFKTPRYVIAPPSQPEPPAGPQQTGNTPAPSAPPTRRMTTTNCYQTSTGVQCTTW